jgi:hypothetical protein
MSAGRCYGANQHVSVNGIKAISRSRSPPDHRPAAHSTMSRQEGIPLLRFYISTTQRTPESGNGGFQLPQGRMEELATLLKKSSRELSYRMQFAEKFPLEENYCNALHKFPSVFFWHLRRVSLFLDFTFPQHSVHLNLALCRRHIEQGRRRLSNGQKSKVPSLGCLPTSTKRPGALTPAGMEIP